MLFHFKIRRYFQIILIFSCQILSGQLPVGSWSDHLRYNTAVSVAAGKDQIYASTGSSVLVYNLTYNELKKLSRVSGLSETGISAISWSEENSILVIAYESCSVDLVNKNSVYNIADIKNKYIPDRKRINRIRTNGKYAYLATGFGIVIIDLDRNEVHDTWKPGSGTDQNEVFDVAFSGNIVYAATETGLWMADITNQGLAWSGNWSLYTGFANPEAKCTHIIYSGSKFFCAVSELTGDLIYEIYDGTRIFLSQPDLSILSLDNTGEGFTISSGSSAEYYDSSGKLIRRISSYGWGEPSVSQCIIKDNDAWIADTVYGLIQCENLNSFSALSLPGPASDNVANIISENGVTIICAGGADNSWNAMERQFMVSVFSNNQYNNIISGSSADAIRACVDPSNSSHFFISSWGDGLFEFKNNVLAHHYDESNSPLVPGPLYDDGIRICGLAMDKNGNLWLTQSNQPSGITVLKSDGSWIVNNFTVNVPIAGDIISTNEGQKWIILPGGNGMFVIDDNNTPDLLTDDTSKRLTVTDSDGKTFNNVYSAAVDLNGNIWIGTDQGPVIYSSGRSVFENDVTGFRIKVPRDDGSGLADYMLGTEAITSIAVDGANRKWLGTGSSGVYQLSENGTTVIKNYRNNNSPLLSDSIASVAADNITGEVWIGTSKGIVSVRELAISGKEDYSKVYAFPNPVREGYSGNLTITGLMAETRIKITDVSGNLVYELMSEGGQASWDLTTYNGKRVSTGIYLIFCSNSDGSGSCVVKVLVTGR